MTALPSTLEGIRAICESFDWPMVVTRGGVISAVNSAWCKDTGFTPPDVEGRPFGMLIAPEERRRFLRRAEQRRVGLPVYYPGSLTAFAVDADGTRRRKIVGVTLVPVAGGDPYIISVTLRIDEPERAIGEEFVAIAAAIVAERAEVGVRAAIVRGFARSGLDACFVRLDGRAFVAVDPCGALPDEFDETSAFEALELSRPLFTGTAVGPSEVYMGVGAADGVGELLHVAGKTLDNSYAVLFRLLAQLFTSALENARLSRESDRKLREVRLLLELARNAAGTLELDALLDLACDALVGLLDMSNCFIMVHDEARSVLRGAASSALHRESFRELVIPVTPETIAGRAALGRSPCFVEDTSVPSASVRLDLVERFDEKALCALPLLSGPRLLGVVILDDVRGPRLFTPEWVELAVAVAGQIALSMANARLVESLKESLGELERTRAEMVKRERLAALGELAAVVAHEVRNPLGVIFNVVSSLRQRITADGEVGALLTMLGQESERLNGIVTELLNFARPTVLSLSRTDLGPVLTEALEVMRAQPERSAGKLRVDLRVGPEIPPVWMDRRLVVQALVNVFSNAAQAMAHGGALRVHAQLEPRAGKGYVVRIDTVDEGPGIPTEIAHRIFEPFFTTRAQGTGLGLAVVKRIVEDHGGDIAVHSRAGEGTTVSIRLPVDAPPTGRAG